MLLLSLLIVAIVVLLGFIVFVITKKPHSNVPSRIEHYKILRELPSGGMSRIFIGERADGHTVVIKIPLERNPRGETLAKFLEEGILLSKLRHPHIVGLDEYGRTKLNGAETGFVALEYIDGYTLDRLVKGGKTFSEQEAAVIVASVADALAAVHRTGVYHRDVSTHNIMITYEGDKVKHVKLIDFGIAKWEGNGDYTTKDMMKEHYASPEQIKRETLDGCTDIFSLGVVFYELVTGHRAFQSWNRKILPFDPISLGVHISRQKNKLIMKMLELNPRKRIQLASDVVRTVGVPPLGGTEYEGLPHTRKGVFKKESRLFSFKKVFFTAGVLMSILIVMILLYHREERPSPRSAVKESTPVAKEPERVKINSGKSNEDEGTLIEQIPKATQKPPKKPAAKALNPQQNIRIKPSQYKVPKKPTVRASCPNCGKFLVGEGFRYCPYCKSSLPKRFWP